MADRDITLFYNTHRLAAMERVLSEQGKSLEYEMYPTLDEMYEKLVPSDEQAEIETLITKEAKEEYDRTEAAKRFAVVHFHEDGDDFHFTTELRNSFYNAAYMYRHHLKDDVGKLTLDSLADNFGDYQPIDELTFSVLCDAMPNDNRITALIEFDFDEGTVGVCESSDNAWWTYNLQDVSAAVYKAERKDNLSLETRQEIFNEALSGKEIDLSPDEDAGMTM